MRINKNGDCVKVWLSANDTYDWAHKPGAAWPCNFLSNKRIFAEFNGGDLIDVAINGGRGDQDCPGHEFNAIMSDSANLIWRLIFTHSSREFFPSAAHFRNAEFKPGMIRETAIPPFSRLAKMTAASEAWKFAFFSTGP